MDLKGVSHPKFLFQDSGPTGGAQSPLAASFDLFAAATGQGEPPPAASGGFPRPPPPPLPTVGPQFDGVPTVPAVTSFEQFR